MARKAKISKGKRMRPTFFVFCEGKTEAAYVNLLRRDFRIPVEIIVKVSDSNISQPYIERCKKERFTTSEDITFLMFDLDVPNMLQNLRKIKDSILLVSNPCIELWFLMHYIEVTKEVTTSQCLDYLKKYDTKYCKGDFSISMRETLLKEKEMASARAKTKESYTNPSSTVYLLLDEMQKHSRSI